MKNLSNRFRLPHGQQLLRRAAVAILVAMSATGCVTPADLMTAIDKSDYQRGLQEQRYADAVAQFYTLETNNGMCLDVHGADAHLNGGRVQVWQCHGRSNQQFRFESGSLVTSEGLCLDVHGKDMRRNGGRVQVWACHGGVNQRWSYDPDRGTLRSAGGLCLDADGHSKHRNGGKVQVWKCLNNVNQNWWTYRAS